MEAIKHLSLLGLRVRDKVTGFEGVVTTVGFELYGCVQAVVHPGLDKDGKPRDSTWFDVSRLTILSDTPVMDVPNFASGPVSRGEQGCDSKPLMRSV